MVVPSSFMASDGAAAPAPKSFPIRLINERAIPTLHAQAEWYSLPTLLATFSVGPPEI